TLLTLVTLLGMAVSIRLRREGAKNRPYYKVVVADSRSPRDGKLIEIIGTYDPRIPEPNSSLNVQRADYVIIKGAQPSDSVRSVAKHLETKRERLCFKRRRTQTRDNFGTRF